jgi:hypothetical protein
VLYINYCLPAQRQYQLQRLDGITWTVVADWQESTMFNNVTVHATYRVAIRTPEIEITINCAPGPYRRVFNFQSGQHIGYVGLWSPLTYTNTVVVGASVQSDINWSFIDANNNDLFNPGEEVKMNTAGTINYDRWWVAIFENGGQNRYWSNGWTYESQIPGDELNLSVMAEGVFDPFEEIPVSYTVQFAIMTECNTVWINLNKNFAVCPAGIPCRIAAGEDIVLAPNPANNSFRLLNVTLNDESRFRLMLTDISGRTVKVYEGIKQTAYDISDLSNGLYIVNVWDGDNRIHTTRLSIVK